MFCHSFKIQLNLHLKSDVWNDGWIRTIGIFVVLVKSIKVLWYDY